jgi:hypothetical protein
MHHFITLLLTLGLVESIFMYFEYYIYNVKGQRSFSFIVANILMLAIRTTVSLVITLLFSLGYGILTNDVKKYMPKIALISFIYFVSNCVYWTVVYINHTTPLSKSILLIISLPISFANSIFSYWILFSLKRTVTTLKETNQEIKLKIIKKFTLSIVIVIAIAMLFFVIDIIVKLVLDRD